MDQIKKNTDNDVQTNAPPVQPGRLFGLTVKEWRELTQVGGSCLWSIVIAIMILAIVFDPNRLESLDQLIGAFGGLAAGYYLSKNMKDN